MINSLTTRLSPTILISIGILAAGCGGGGDDGPTGPGEDTTPPSVSISSPSDGETVTEGDAVFFEGSAEDDRDGRLSGSSMTWSSDLDGDLGTGRRVDRDDLSLGEHRITLAATDAAGNEGTATVSLTVESNDPPAASIASPADGDTIGEGAPLPLRGSATDPQEGPLSGGSLVWSSSLDGELGAGEEMTRDDLSVGTHSIRLVASDPQGLADTASVTVTVEANGQPSVTIDQPADGAAFDEGESVTFQGSATDPEDGTLTGNDLTWSSDLDGDLGTGEQVTRSDLSPGSHTITLTATDGRNASTSTSIALDIEGAPAVTVSSPADRTVFAEGDAITFEGSADDPTEGALSGSSLRWASDADGELGTGESLTLSTLSGGPHLVSLTATDSDGHTGSDTVSILLEAPGFDIRVRFVDELSSSQEQAVLDAVAPWEAAVTGDLSPVFLSSQEADACEADGRKGIDDLHIAVRLEDIDGTGGTLARAGPRAARTDAAGSFTTPICGVVEIDEADVGNSQLEEIVVHEIGHVMGIGIGALQGWGSNADVTDSRDPFFTGVNTVSAFRDDLEGQAYLSDGVPLANAGGQGTAGAHWREANFRAELMTGFLNAGVENPLSVVSVASLADIGFQVDPGAADPYSLPMPQPALWEVAADATLSHPSSSDENFGVPDGSALSEAIVVGANNGFWTSDPNGEVLTGLLRLDVPSLPSGVSLTDADLELTVDRIDTETTGHSIELLRVTEDWTEDVVTWDARPGFDGSPLLTYAFDESSPLLSSSNLVGLARDWATGAVSNQGLGLRAPDAASDSTFSVGYFTRHETNPRVRPRMRVRAETTPSLAASRQPLDGEAPPGDGIDLHGDILAGPLYGVGPDGGVVRVVEIR